eukprot:455689_1
MSTEYKLLQPGGPQNEKKNETKEIELNYDEKNGLFLSTTLYLKSINIEKQEFDVKGWIHVFWNDSYLLQQLTNNNNNCNTRKYSDLSTQIQNHLPLKPKDGYLFENSKLTSFITEPIIEYNSNGAFRMTIQMESIFDQPFILNDYPYDAHILNLKLLYNYNKYKWEQIWNKESKWLQEYDEDKIKLYNWDNTVSFAMYKCNSTQWKAVRPNVHFNKEFNFYLISFRIERKNSTQSNICCNVIAPLFIVIGCTFSIYGFSYYEWSMRLFIIFISFIFTAIIHATATIKKYEVRSYIFLGYIILALLMSESMMLGFNVFDFDSQDDMDTFDLISAIVLGVLWLFGVICVIRRNGSNNPRTEKYWKQQYKKQWKKWKKSEFIHL